MIKGIPPNLKDQLERFISGEKQGEKGRGPSKNGRFWLLRSNDIDASIPTLRGCGSGISIHDNDRLKTTYQTLHQTLVLMLSKKATILPVHRPIATRLCTQLQGNLLGDN
jgi:hypothetical protein